MTGFGQAGVSRRDTNDGVPLSELIRLFNLYVDTIVAYEKCSS